MLAKKIVALALLTLFLLFSCAGHSTSFRAKGDMTTSIGVGSR